MREGTHEDTIDMVERLQEEKDELLAEVKRLRKGIEEIVDYIDNGYIRNAESCADDLRGLIE